MKKFVLPALATMLFTFSSCEQKKNAVVPGELDLHSMIRPIPATAKFITDRHP